MECDYIYFTSSVIHKFEERFCYFILPLNYILEAYIILYTQLYLFDDFSF